LFGPSIVIGGCMGGSIGLVLTGLPIAPPLPACILMGMAGMLAASHRTPVAALLMVSEVAGTYLLLVPTMWVVGLAFLFTGRRSLVAGQVDSIQDSPAHRSHLFADVLATARVAEVIAAPRAWVTIPTGADLETCRKLTAETNQDQFPVVRPDGHLVGMIDRPEITRMAPDALLAGMVLADDLAGGAGVALSPQNTLAEVLQRLHHQHVDELPVIDEQGRFLGMVTSGMLMDHYRQQVEKAQAERRAEGFTTSSDHKQGDYFGLGQ
jgi:chloride channel protein, CIC family